MKGKTVKLPMFIALLISSCMIFNSGSVFASVNPDFLNVDDIEIIEQHGIVEGSSCQLKAELTPGNALESAVKWSSSNPSVISCTDDGVITGVSAGGYADITCKAKFGSASDKIRVYCVESIDSNVSSRFKNIITFIYAEPSYSRIVAWHFDYMSFIMNIIAPVFKVITLSNTVPDANEFMIFSSKCDVLGRYKSYAYISLKSDKGERDGFVKYSNLLDVTNEFLKLSAKNMDVWGNGYVNTSKKLTSDYKGEIKWNVTDKSIVNYDEETGQVTGIKPGKTTITATADGVTEFCTIHSLYRWPQTWKTKTNCDTSLYTADTSDYKVTRILPIATPFEVFGDNGTSDGWAYGKATINGKGYWGYVPIDKVSTKNTISFYNNLNWGYPLKNEEYNLIYSPFAPRASENDEHRGIDINEKSGQADIEGQPLVAVFDGVVKEAKYSSSAGNYVCITSKHDTDTVTGEKIIAIYMHMQYLPSVSKGDVVEKGKTFLGYAGNTGGSKGSHLHFEANNKNAVVDDEIRRSYTYTINPIYFYMNQKFKFNNSCSAVENGYGFYWYNYDK